MLQMHLAQIVHGTQDEVFDWMTLENSPRGVARAPLGFATMVVGHIPSHYRQNQHLQEWRMVTSEW